MKKIIRKLFAPIALLSLALGVGITLNNHKDVVKTEATATTVTVTRSDFTNTGNYTEANWSKDGISGTGNIYGPSSGYIQLRTTSKPYPHNKVETPGPITNITVKMPGSGTARSLTPRVSATVPITTETGGAALTTKTFTNNSATLSWDIDAVDNIKFFHLVPGGNTNWESFSFTFEASTIEFGTLSKIELNTDGAKLDFLVGNTFETTGLIVTAFDTDNVTKTVSDYSTDYDSHVFTVSDVGTKPVTVSYSEGGVTVTATYNIQVTNPQSLAAINNLSGIHFGATYALGNKDEGVAMKAEHTTYFPKYDATFSDELLVEESDTQLFTIEIGVIQNSFALKLVNGPKEGEYISYTGSSNAIYTSTTLDSGSSWMITFDVNGNADIVNAQITTRKIKYNSATTGLRFAAYTTAQTPVKLYVAESTIDSTVSAERLADEINDGRGHNAEGNCERLLGVFQGARNQLSTTAKSIFDTSADAKYVNARARMAYLQAWVDSNGTSSPRQVATNDTNNVAAVVLIGVIGLTTLVGYYFINKKRLTA